MHFYTFLENVTIESDGVTVWVNDAVCCIGRFGRFGIDIHRRAGEQHDKGECLHCTYEKVRAADWLVFVAKMKEYYGVDVPEKHKPKRFQT